MPASSKSTAMAAVSQKDKLHVPTQDIVYGTQSHFRAGIARRNRQARMSSLVRYLKTYKAI